MAKKEKTIDLTTNWYFELCEKSTDYAPIYVEGEWHDYHLCKECAGVE